MNLSLYSRLTLLSLSLVTIAFWSACNKTSPATSNMTPTPPDTTRTSGTPPPPPALKKWIVTTFAGSGVSGYANGDSTQAEFANPQGIAVDNQGNVIVGDWGNASIRSITPKGVVTTYVSNTVNAPSLPFGNIAGLAADQQGNIFEIDYDLVRKIASPTNTSVFAGQMLIGYQDGPGSTAEFNLVFNLAVDTSNNIFVPDYDMNNVFHLREISPAGQVSTMALQDNTGVSGNGLPNYHYLYAIAVNPKGGFYITCNGNNMIKKIDAQGNVSVFAGWTIGFTDGPGSTALFGTITGMSCDSAGNLYVADATNNAIRMVTPGGIVSTIGGNGTAGFIDGDSTKAEFHNPFGVAVDKNSGAVYVTDEMNNCIRKLEYR